MDGVIGILVAIIVIDLIARVITYIINTHSFRSEHLTTTVIWVVALILISLRVV